MIEIAVHAHGAENSVRFAGGAMNVEAAGDQAVDHVLDLRFVAPSCMTITMVKPRLLMRFASRINDPVERPATIQN